MRVPPVGLEPTHLASEASTLSAELRGHIHTVQYSRRYGLAQAQPSHPKTWSKALHRPPISECGICPEDWLLTAS